jgi:hypothetical protein
MPTYVYYVYIYMENRTVIFHIYIFTERKWNCKYAAVSNGKWKSRQLSLIRLLFAHRANRNFLVCLFLTKNQQKLSICKQTEQTNWTCPSMVLVHVYLHIYVSINVLVHFHTHVYLHSYIACYKIAI